MNTGKGLRHEGTSFGLTSPPEPTKGKTMWKTIAAMGTLVFALLLGVAYVSPTTSSIETQRGVNPAAVKVVAGENVVCSGTHMGDGVIMTAEHCVMDGVDYSVVFQDGNRYTVSDTKMGEQFAEYDIALFYSDEISRLLRLTDTTLPEADLYCEAVPIGGEIFMQGSPGIPWYTQLDGNMMSSFGWVADSGWNSSSWAIGATGYVMTNVGGFSGAGIVYDGKIAFVNSGAWKNMMETHSSLAFGSTVSPVCWSDWGGL